MLIIAHAEPGGKGTRLTFCFDVPEDLESSDTDRDVLNVVQHSQSAVGRSLHYPLGRHTESSLGAVIALYTMTNSLEVFRDGNDIKTVRRILGVAVKRRSMSRNAFVKFTKSSSFQSQGGGKHVIYYSIYVTDIDGRKLRVGEGFKGESEARAAIRLIGRELGLQHAAARREVRDPAKSWNSAGLLSRSQ